MYLYKYGLCRGFSFFYRHSRVEPKSLFTAVLNLFQHLILIIRFNQTLNSLQYLPCAGGFSFFYRHSRVEPKSLFTAVLNLFQHLILIIRFNQTLNSLQ